MPLTARHLLPLAGALTIAGALSAAPRQHAPPPAAADPALLQRPTPVPDRVILTIADAPSRKIAVSWRTDGSVNTPVVQVAPADADPKFAAKAATYRAQESHATATDLGPARQHSAVIDGLQPDTLYAYRVGDGVNWSEWFHTRTAADGPKPFAFVYFGDAQTEIKSLWSRAIRTAWQEAPQARLMIHAGDLINRSGSDLEWGEWHAAGGWVNGMIPSAPTPGNHEYAKLTGLDPHWRTQFALPENGPAGLEETAYCFDFQGVRFVSLNSEEKTDAQVAWLDRVLEQNPNRWTVLTFHRPLFSSAKGRDNAALRAAWLPIVDRHRVDLVLQGHDHTYARSKNLRYGLSVQNGQGGTMFVVSVSGPKMYNVETQDWMRRTAEDTQLFQIVTVDGDRLRYQARTVTGEIYDAFELVKGRSGRNRLIDRAPRTPERRRPGSGSR